MVQQSYFKNKLLKLAWTKVPVPFTKYLVSQFFRGLHCIQKYPVTSNETSAHVNRYFLSTPHEQTAPARLGLKAAFF